MKIKSEIEIFLDKTFYNLNLHIHLKIQGNLFPK